MKYDEKDVPLFKKVICNHCDSYELSCIKRHKEDNKHWFLMCPKFFNWAIGLKYNNGLMEKVNPKREEF
jgi:hypothetical protein